MKESHKLNSIYDFTFVGAGPSASLTSIEILSKMPNARILIIEKSLEFPMKVGESLSDLSALYLKRLKIPGLLEKQIQKTGLRFYFSPEQKSQIDDYKDYASPSFEGESNGYQLNRKEFDQRLLERAEELGATILRPATFVDYSELDNGLKVIYVKSEDENRKIYKSKWLIDTSGQRRILTHRWKWINKYEALETASSWAHFKLKDEHIAEGLKSKKVGWPNSAIGKSDAATEHYMGEGYWAWKFPLNNNEISFGFVYDKRIKRIHDRNAKNDFKKFIDQHKVLNILNTQYDMINYKHKPHLPYLSSKLIDPKLSIAAIGDSAGFIDPLFSPGLELVCQQSLNISKILIKDLNNECIDIEAKKYNSLFLGIFKSRFLLYENRYQVMNDFEVFSLWSQLDLTAYLGLNVIPTTHFPKLIKIPPHFTKLSAKLYELITRRLVSLSKEKIEIGINNESLPSTLNSYFKVRKNHLKWLQPFVLLGVFTYRYSALELRVLRKKLSISHLVFGLFQKH